MYIYLASPYHHAEMSTMERRAYLAREMAAQLAVRGKLVYCPIASWHEAAKEFKLPKTFDYWRQLNVEFLRRSDHLYILRIPGWAVSAGINDEVALAQNLGLPITLVWLTGSGELHFEMYDRFLNYTTERDKPL